MSIPYETAPNNLGDSLKRYIENRIPMGGFMTAVLENNLSEAMGCADIYNRACLFDIVSWIYNEAPTDCWGSPEKVRAWLNGKNGELS